MRRSAAAGLWCLIVWIASAHAQSDWRTTAVPFYSAEQYAQGMAVDNLARATAWGSTAGQLRSDLDRWCSGVVAGPDAAPTASTLRADWRAAVTAWDRLDSVALGPLVERRSARAVDFMPVRPTMLERAVQTAPKDAAAMELIGTPAKGFEALEWLFWPEVPVPGTPRCAYAAAVARHHQREAVALVAAYGATAAAGPEPEQASAALSQVVNQWVGGVERLRWAFMRKPIEVARSRNEPAAFARQRSDQTGASWAARWSTLRSFAVLGGRDRPPRTGGDQLIAFETWLRSRGANNLADKLVHTTEQADQAMAHASPDRPESVEHAADALAQLARLMQTELAPALRVSIGFSDADGD